MFGIRQIAQKEGVFSLRELQSGYGADSARHLLAAYAIKQKYVELGEVFSPLDLPIDDDLNAIANISTKSNPLGGYEAQFSGGRIAVKNIDNIAVEEITNKVKVWFVGLECLFQQESSDEIYGTIGVIEPDTKFSRTVNFGDGVNLVMSEDNTRVIELELLLYDDVPKDIVLTINLVEHDSGDIDEYKRRIAAALGKAANEGLHSLGVPAEPTAASSGWMGDLTWGITNILAGWLGADDDPYNPHGFRISRKEMLIDIGIKNGTIKGVPSPFQDQTLDRSDVTFHYNIEPKIVKGTDQGGDLGKYAFYFKVETIPSVGVL